MTSPDRHLLSTLAVRRRAVTSQSRLQSILFWSLVAIGFLLGGLVLFRAYVTYRYVSSEFVVGYLMREAATLVLQLESISRQELRPTPDSLMPVLQALHGEHADRVAWIAICDDSGNVAAHAGSSARACGADAVKRVLELRAPVTESREEARERVLVVTIPYGLRQDPSRVIGGGMNVAQVALFVDRGGGPLAPLQRTVTLTVTAALALMASMVMAALWFPSFLRGKQLAQQMRLAREVQQLLLPSAFPAQSEIDIAATCLPAWDVGGDYYDVFRDRGGNVVLVLADVAGKGVSAGLLTALVHGAVHASSHSVDEPARLVRDINDLLYGRTADNRYATMFWARFNPRERSFDYVNAGHLPPFVVHQTINGVTVQRLETGGPVVGLLPGAPYDSASAQLHSGDVLVMYSDGLTEAENGRNEEFGEERLAAILVRARHETATEVLQEILRAVRDFVGRQPFRDDLTVLVVKVL
jgi:serine phosphatase RsbU (regulator of sigma subunit)